MLTSASESGTLVHFTTQTETHVHKNNACNTPEITEKFYDTEFH
jgi:hypothetical protein